MKSRNLLEEEVIAGRAPGAGCDDRGHEALVDPIAGLRHATVHFASIVPHERQLHHFLRYKYALLSPLLITATFIIQKI